MQQSAPQFEQYTELDELQTPMPPWRYWKSRGDMISCSEKKRSGRESIGAGEGIGGRDGGKHARVGRLLVGENVPGSCRSSDFSCSSCGMIRTGKGCQNSEK